MGFGRVSASTSRSLLTSAYGRSSSGNGGDGDDGGDDEDLVPVVPANGRPAASATSLPDGPALTEASTDLLARAGVIEEEDLDSSTRRWLDERGLLPEDFSADYGLLAPEDAVIIRPYGGEDDDILLQELRPRFVVMYEPNLAFIRRLEVSSGRELPADGRYIRIVIQVCRYVCTR